MYEDEILIDFDVFFFVVRDSFFFRNFYYFKWIFGGVVKMLFVVNCVRRMLGRCIVIFVIFDCVYFVLVVILLMVMIIIK